MLFFFKIQHKLEDFSSSRCYVDKRAITNSVHLHFFSSHTTSWLRQISMAYLKPYKSIYMSQLMHIERTGREPLRYYHYLFCSNTGSNFQCMLPLTTIIRLFDTNTCQWNETLSIFDSIKSILIHNILFILIFLYKSVFFGIKICFLSTFVFLLKYIKRDYNNNQRWDWL